MRTLILTAFFALASTLTGSPVFAQTGDDVTPAEESICDPLKAEGVTKGLYGLCIAYCEAETQSQDVLDNYNWRKTDADPAMPCGCPCWSSIVSIEGAILLCGTDGESANEDVSFLYIDPPDVFLETYGVSINENGDLECAHVADLADVSRDVIDSTEEQICRADLYSVCPVE